MASDKRDAGAGRRASDTGKPVGAVVNAVNILRYLSEQSAPVRAAQVARALGVNTSTCFNILRTLVREDFASFDAVHKSYKIGGGIADLVKGSSIFGRNVDVIRGLIERIARDQDVAVTLWRPVAEDRMLLILAAFPPGSTRIHMSVGERLPLLIGSAGRIMAAFKGLKTRDLRRQFRALRWDQPISYDQYMAEVQLARERGWSIDRGTYLSGIASVAIPVLDANSNLLMACSGTTFAHKLDESRARVVAAALAQLREWSSFRQTRDDETSRRDGA